MKPLTIHDKINANAILSPVISLSEVFGSYDGLTPLKVLTESRKNCFKLGTLHHLTKVSKKQRKGIA